MSTEADTYSRLGQPEQVADATVAIYRRRSFSADTRCWFLVFPPCVARCPGSSLRRGGDHGPQFAQRRCCALAERPTAILTATLKGLPYVMSLSTVSFLGSGEHSSTVACQAAGHRHEMDATGLHLLAMLAAMPCCSVTLFEPTGATAP